MPTNKDNDFFSGENSNQTGHREMAANIKEQVDPTQKVEGNEISEKLAEEESLNRLEAKPELIKTLPNPNGRAKEKGSVTWLLVIVAAIIGVIVWVLYT